jgi:hypothetical protein
LQGKFYNQKTFTVCCVRPCQQEQPGVLSHFNRIQEHHDQMKTIGIWVLNQRIPLLISCSFGFLATLLYFVASYAPGGGRLGVWYSLYYVSWPASWLANQITARFEGHVPDRLFEFLYVAGIIVGGAMWFFLITLFIKYAVAKLKTD